MDADPSYLEKYESNFECPADDDIILGKFVWLGIYNTANKGVKQLQNLSKNSKISKSEFSSIDGTSIYLVLVLDNYPKFSNAAVINKIYEKQIGNMWIKIPADPDYWAGSYKENPYLGKISDSLCYMGFVHPLLSVAMVSPGDIFRGRIEALNQNNEVTDQLDLNFEIIA